MKGRIHKIAGNTYEVHTGAQVFACKFRGKIKRERTRESKLAAVGQDVEFEPSGAGEGIIEAVLRPRTRCSPADPQRPRMKQVVVANASCECATSVSQSLVSKRRASCVHTCSLTFPASQSSASAF